MLSKIINRSPLYMTLSTLAKRLSSVSSKETFLISLAISDNFTGEFSCMLTGIVSNVPVWTWHAEMQIANAAKNNNLFEFMVDYDLRCTKKMVKVALLFVILGLPLNSSFFFMK